MNVSINADWLGEFIHELEELRDFKPDLSGLVEPITQIVEQEHRRARLAGLDVHGDPLTPVKNGSWTPLAPHGSSSRVVTNFEVEVTPTDRGINIQADYSGIPWITYHKEDAGHLPVRDVMGIEQAAITKAEAIVLQEISDQVNELL